MDKTPRYDTFTWTQWEYKGAKAAGTYSRGGQVEWRQSNAVNAAHSQQAVLANSTSQKRDTGTNTWLSAHPSCASTPAAKGRWDTWQNEIGGGRNGPWHCCDWLIQKTAAILLLLSPSPEPALQFVFIFQNSFVSLLRKYSQNLPAEICVDKPSAIWTKPAEILYLY